MNPACFGKVGFYTSPEAEAAAKKMRRRTERIILAYRCPACRRWHVGETMTRTVKSRLQQTKGRYSETDAP
jgi:hypothetical protein